MVDARVPIIDGDEITDRQMRDVWTWPDEAHFLLIAAGHLGTSVAALGWTEDYAVDWSYITHLRNAWEHRDDRGWYLRDYSMPHGSAVWSGGSPGFIDQLRVDDLVKVGAAIIERVDTALPPNA